MDSISWINSPRILSLSPNNDFGLRGPWINQGKSTRKPNVRISICFLIFLFKNPIDLHPDVAFPGDQIKKNHFSSLFFYNNAFLSVSVPMTLIARNKPFPFLSMNRAPFVLDFIQTFLDPHVGGFCRLKK